MFCQNCGQEIVAGTKFCTGCGQPVPAEQTAPEPVQPIEAQPVPEPEAVEPEPFIAHSIHKPADDLQPQAFEAAAAAAPVAAAFAQEPSPATEILPEPEVPAEQPLPVQPAPVEQPVAPIEEPVSQAVPQPAPEPMPMQPIQEAPVPVQPAPAMQQPVQPTPAPVAPVAPAAPAQPEAKPVKAKKEKAPKPAKVKKEKSGKKKKLWIIPVVALVLALAVAAGGFFFWQDGKKTRKAKDSYSDLCDMTSLGAQSYLYARVLTERILETDLATADPEETENLIKECIDAWDATEGVAGDIQSMAEDLDDSGDTDRLKPSKGGFLANMIYVFAGRSVYAAGGGDEEEVGDVLPPDESIEQCVALSEQISVDTTVCSTRIRQLQGIYNGRSTNYEEWNSVVEQTSTCFTNVVFLSGEVINGDSTMTLDGQPRSVYQISTEPKPGATTIENTDILIDVGSSSSTFVMSSTESVTINEVEMQEHLSSSSTGSTISISTRQVNTSSVSMTFHRTSFTSWFILDTVGGFTITRGDKDDDGILTPPEVESGNIEPDPVSCPIVDWLPPIGADDINNERNVINGEEIETDDTETTVNSTTLDERVTTLEAGVGEITVSVLWGTHDDVDLHVITPNDNRIYYANRTADGGTLDIDMNASSSNLVDSPIENIYFPTPGNGHYAVYLRDFRDRTEDMETSYLVRVTIGDQTEEYEGEIDGTGTEILIVEFDYNDATEVTREPITEETLDTLLRNAGAGEGMITVSLTWDAWDDVDLHIITPDDSHVCYYCKSAGGGVLDHDANAGYERTLEPVENIVFPFPSNGHYRIYINQYKDRSEDYEANYFVRVTIGDESQIFSGTIDGTGTTIDILEFDYGDAVQMSQTSYTGHTYAYIDSQMSWTSARTFAQSLGGHLVAINDADEQAFIESRFPNTYGWIGFVNTSIDCGWVTGEPVDYTNFCDVQPENFGEEELFGFLYTDMQWGFTYYDDVEYHQGFYIEWDEVLEGAVDGVLTEETLDSILQSLDAGEGDITISLLWDSTDDLDLHVFTPDGSEIYYSNRSAQGGSLDIDANASESSMMTNPVENIYFSSPYNGEYWIYVNDYRDRTEGSVTNFIVRITVGGESQLFNGTIDETGTTLEIAGFEYTGGTDPVLDENTLDDVLNSLEAGEGEITISMLWDSTDDLDLHVETPDGSEIYYSNRSAQGGTLDIDANAGGNMMDNPIENVYFATPENGTYRVWIKDYSDRTEGTTNYIVRITVGGESQTFSGTIDSSGTVIDILTFTYGGATDGNTDENTLDNVLDTLEAGTGEITVSMLWSSSDDLDLHMRTPDDSEIYYSNRSAQGGTLDIDANAGGNIMDNPVENIYFESPESGQYSVWIEDYSDRSDGPTDYIVRITVGGQSQTFSGTIDGTDTVIEIADFNYGL